MKILVINCGSSSLKYQVLDMENEELLAKGLVDRIGIVGSVLCHEKTHADKFYIETPMKDHKEAIKHVLETLLDKENGVLASMDEIGAVGHRVVHAGEKYAYSVFISQDVIDALEECTELAPLHNPPNLLGIAACKELMPDTPMVGVFDTAFHQTMGEEAYIYAIPYEFYKKYGIRRYGFHGTSHKYVAERAAAMLDRNPEDFKVITCHLGNGSSITAVKNGNSVNTSMGFTPLEGLVMGTRSGDLDPAILAFIADKEKLNIDQVTSILNKKSGLLGLSGITNDLRDIEKAAREGDKQSQMAIKVFAHRVKLYIGSYMAEMNGADAIVFTAGIGENDIGMRKYILENLENLGIILDEEANNIRAEERIISAPDSKVKILLIPTNEELMIARDTASIVEAM